MQPQQQQLRKQKQQQQLIAAAAAEDSLLTSTVLGPCHLSGPISIFLPSIFYRIYCVKKNSSCLNSFLLRDMLPGGKNIAVVGLKIAQEVERNPLPQLL
jgi:hypothetical protein